MKTTYERFNSNLYSNKVTIVIQILLKGFPINFRYEKNNVRKAYKIINKKAKLI